MKKIIELRLTLLSDRMNVLLNLKNPNQLNFVSKDLRYFYFDPKKYFNMGYQAKIWYFMYKVKLTIPLKKSQ